MAGCPRPAGRAAPHPRLSAVPPRAEDDPECRLLTELRLAGHADDSWIAVPALSLARRLDTGTDEGEDQALLLDQLAASKAKALTHRVEPPMDDLQKARARCSTRGHKP